jgi:hypothetical protein
MKKVTLLCALLLAVSASVAAAAGVGLRWSSCLSDGGLPNRAFACNSNAGTNTLVGTFETNAAGLAQVSGNEVVIDLASASTPLPAWWQMKNAGTCRQSALTMNFVAPATATNCVDWAVGAAAGGIGAYNIGLRGPNTARIVAALAVAPDNLQDLTGGQEYFSFNINISNVKTVGTGLCAGCQDPVCIVFNSINLTTPVLANNVFLTGASNGTDGNFCTWQGGAGVVTPGGSGCPQATPTKNKTWSQVKALYR